MATIIISFIVFVSLAVLDQVTKLIFFGKSFSLIGDFLWIEGSSLNTGAAGGMLAGQMWLFISLAVIASAVCIYMMISKKFSTSAFFKISVAITFAGIVGNLIDRIIFNGVRDFIYFKSINFFIFNFADIYLTIGAVCLCIYLLFLHKDAPLKRKTKSEEKVKDE